MKIVLFLLALSILRINVAVSQEKQFTIEGIINIDTGYVKLILVGDSSFYPKSRRDLMSPVQNGKFMFEGKIPHPIAYKIESSGYLSDVIVIEPGKQWVRCNVDSSRLVPEIKNNVMKEYTSYRTLNKGLREQNNLFDQESNRIGRQYPQGIPDTLKLKMEMRMQELYNKSDQSLLSFVKDNPGSYWALWRLINLTDFGYESIFDQIMPLFADSIKETETGKRLAQKIEEGGVLSIGKKFPLMELTDANGAPSPGPSFRNSKYTLLDFWYTDCAPCIATFPSLMNVFNKYHSKGFEIAGIATDATKYGKDIPVVVKKHKLKWSQYWDINGKGANELHIRAFPTTFLIDSTGTIVQRNIRSAELAKFLEKNL